MLSACPFLRAKRGASEPGVKSKCPFGFTRSSADQVPDTHEPISATTPTATCPYGFSSKASGQALSQLHCPLCKQWLHDPVQLTPCQHKFCAYCASLLRDCPVCGQDIQERTTDTEAQELVEKLLDAHVAVARQQDTGASAGSHDDPSSPDSATGPLPELPPLMPGAGPSSAASLLLHLGLQALRGGNPAAALHRLELCKTELLREIQTATATTTHVPSDVSPAPPATTSYPPAIPKHARRPVKAPAQKPSRDNESLQRLLQQVLPPTQADGGGGAKDGLSLPPVCGTLGERLQLVTPDTALPANLACPLAVVFGSQGDAAKYLGSYRAATALHAAGARALRAAAADGNEEALHALTVSMNKLGDDCYLDQDLAKAVKAYRAALALRRTRLLRAMSSSSCTAAVAVTRIQTLQPSLDDDDMDNDLMDWPLQGLQPECVNQALDCAASLIKIADAYAAHVNLPAATQAAEQAQALIDACHAQLPDDGRASPNTQRPVTAGGGATDEAGGVACGGVLNSAALQRARCEQLSQIVRGLDLHAS